MVDAYFSTVVLYLLESHQSYWFSDLQNNDQVLFQPWEMQFDSKGCLAHKIDSPLTIQMLVQSLVLLMLHGITCRPDLFEECHRWHTVLDLSPQPGTLPRTRGERPRRLTPHFLKSRRAMSSIHVWALSIFYRAILDPHKLVEHQQ